jgi:hypothetical protein
MNVATMVATIHRFKSTVELYALTEKHGKHFRQHRRVAVSSQTQRSLDLSGAGISI